MKAQCLMCKNNYNYKCLIAEKRNDKSMIKRTTLFLILILIGWCFPIGYIFTFMCGVYAIQIMKELNFI